MSEAHVYDSDLLHVCLFLLLLFFLLVLFLPQPTVGTVEALEILSGDFLSSSTAHVVQAPVVTPPAPRAEVTCIICNLHWNGMCAVQMGNPPLLLRTPLILR